MRKSQIYTIEIPPSTDVEKALVAKIVWKKSTRPEVIKVVPECWFETDSLITHVSLRVLVRIRTFERRINYGQTEWTTWLLWWIHQTKAWNHSVAYRRSIYGLTVVACSTCCFILSKASKINGSAQKTHNSCTLFDNAQLEVIIGTKALLKNRINPELSRSHGPLLDSCFDILSNHQWSTCNAVVLIYLEVERGAKFQKLFDC